MEPENQPEVLPVGRERRSTGEWQQVYLTGLAAAGNVRAACKLAGISRKAAYQRRALDPDFANDWDEALESFCDILEGEAVRRALGGSDRLLIELLKSRRPELYDRARRVELTTPALSQEQLAAMTDQQLAHIVKHGKLPDGL